jgi:hypothetical protein
MRKFAMTEREFLEWRFLGEIILASGEGRRTMFGVTHRYFIDPFAANVALAVERTLEVEGGTEEYKKQIELLLPGHSAAVLLARAVSNAVTIKQESMYEVSMYIRNGNSDCLRQLNPEVPYPKSL